MGLDAEERGVRRAPVYMRSRCLSSIVPHMGLSETAGPGRRECDEAQFSFRLERTLDKNSCSRPGERCLKTATPLWDR